ncbi:MAG: hypothetical protein JWN48_5750 [Myxococcaceae bacterium]|nr:hypothetical protein [Myxococcaceae bacterium]
MTLLENLFDADAPETRGERVQAMLFELISVLLCAGYAWSWVEPMTHQRRVVRALGLANYLDVSPLFDLRFAVGNAALISCLVAVGFVLRQRLLYLGAALLLHLQFVARHGMGKVSHGSHLVGTALLALGLAALFVQPARVRRAALGLTVFLAGLGYTSAAACKLIATGPRWVDGHNLWLWISEKQLDLTAQHGSAQLNLLQAWLMQNRTLATAVLLIGLSTELLAWLMWWKKLRPLVMLAVVGMHLGIQATLDVAFTANVVVLCTVALPLAAWIDRYDLRTAKKTKRSSNARDQVGAA